MSLIVSKKYSLDSDSNWSRAELSFSESDYQNGSDIYDADYYQYEQILGCEEEFCVLYTANDDEIARVLA
jgi:hypothetical protein